MASLSEMLYRIGCIKFGSFKLTSGALSPVYVDLRLLPSHPEEFEAVVDMCVEAVSSLCFDAVCGIATGGIPLATLIAYKTRRPLIYVRKGERRHGTRRLVEGDYRERWRVLLVDDVATTGGSLTQGVKALRGVGLDVENALVVVDREQGAAEGLGTIGVRLHRVATLRDVVEELYGLGLISNEDYRRVVNYLSWGGDPAR